MLRRCVLSKYPMAPEGNGGGESQPASLHLQRGMTDRRTRRRREKSGGEYVRTYVKRDAPERVFFPPSLDRNVSYSSKELKRARSETERARERLQKKNISPSRWKKEEKTLFAKSSFSSPSVPNFPAGRTVKRGQVQCPKTLQSREEEDLKVKVSSRLASLSRNKEYIKKNLLENDVLRRLRRLPLAAGLRRRQRDDGPGEGGGRWCRCSRAGGWTGPERHRGRH